MPTARIERWWRVVPAPASPVQAVLAAAGALAVLTALVVHPTHADPDLAGPVRPAPVAPDPSPAAVTPADLSRLASTLRRPIYWVGPRVGVTYELRRTAAGHVFVRYLPAGAPPGAEGSYLTVATYPVADALRVTQAFVSRGGFGSRPVAGGGLAAYRLAQPTNVYVVFPGLDYQLEVFSPDPAEALRLATNGALRRAE